MKQAYLIISERPNIFNIFIGRIGMITEKNTCEASLASKVSYILL